MSAVKLTITGSVLAKLDKVDFVKAELLKLIDVTRAEEGCIQYDLHQDNNNPAQFLFYENWESRELWQKHMENTHIAAYLEATEGAVENFTLGEWTRIA
ncbi:MAG: putative quinol monooxygenase [Verrucomicrobiota bacterium]